MKVVILAGGQRSTISNEQVGIPKPMAEIGGKPILWHIMQYFASHGLNEFVICGGYKVNMIKEYFMDYYIYQSDITVDLQTNLIEIHKNRTENWKVTVVDTGVFAATGQRVAQIRDYIEEDTFVVTDGDCLFDIRIDRLIEEHNKHGKLATMVVARPTGRNKAVTIGNEGLVRENEDYIGANQAWANAGMYVLHRKVFDFIGGNYSLEQALIHGLASRAQMVTYKHDGFWAPVETYRDRVDMENLWNAGMAPWVRPLQY